MKISINPTYNCSKNCWFCYLSHKEKSNIINLDKLDNILNSINENIEVIDLYGGEILELEEDYINKLIDISKKYCNTVNLITRRPDLLDKVKRNVNIAISYEPYLDKIYDFSNKDLISLSLPSLLDKDFSTVCNHFNSLNLNSLELKYYSHSKNNPQEDLNEDKFNKLVIYLSYNLNCKFVNKDNIVKSILNKTNNYCNDHVYINPDGNFQTLIYKNNQEEFININNIKLRKLYDTQNLMSSGCNNCSLLGKCLSEHFKSNPCNGFKSLIQDWHMRRFAFLDKQDGSDLIDKPIYDFENTEYWLRKYFSEVVYDCIYPAKQIFVELVYSLVLSKYFNLNRLDLLKDDFLAPSIFRDNLYYEIRQKMFDLFILNTDLSRGTVPITVEYCKKEFGL